MGLIIGGGNTKSGGGGGDVRLETNHNATIETNGTHVVTPTDGYDGMRKATITVSVPSEGTRLPQGYTELSWVELKQGAIIDTGITIDISHTIIGKGQMIGNSSYQSLFSVYTRESADCTRIMRNKTAVGQYLINFFTKAEVGSTIINMADGQYIDYILSYGIVDVNGKSYTLSKVRGEAYTNRLRLGGSNIRHYYFGIKENDVYIVDFVACISPDGKIGMYDYVSGVVFESQGGIIVGGDALDLQLLNDNFGNVIIPNLPNLVGQTAKTITLSKYNYDAISQDNKAALSAKNWNLASA